MEIKRVTMIGVGAVGAVLASKLNGYLGKENVECLADGERKARYERDGIFLNGIQSEREIAKVYGEENLLYGFVISLNSIHEGRILIRSHAKSRPKSGS